MVQSYGITSNKRQGIFSSFWRPFIRGKCLIEDIEQDLTINQIWIRKNIII